MLLKVLWPIWIYKFIFIGFDDDKNIMTCQIRDVLTWLLRMCLNKVICICYPFRQLDIVVKQATKDVEHEYLYKTFHAFFNLLADASKLNQQNLNIKKWNVFYRIVNKFVNFLRKNAIHKPCPISDGSSLRTLILFFCNHSNHIQEIVIARHDPSCTTYWTRQVDDGYVRWIQYLFKTTQFTQWFWVWRFEIHDVQWWQL